MLFDGKVEKLRINGLVSKSFEACADPEGRGGGQVVRTPPPEKSQTYNNSGADPLKKRKATKPTLNVGPLAARTRNVSLAGRCWPAYCGI